ncbi:hypothetical protein CBL_12101 [Carabus blaptoides fortunei]
MQSAQPPGSWGYLPHDPSSIGTTRTRKNKDSGSFSDAAKPMNPEVGGGTTTPAPTPRTYASTLNAVAHSLRRQVSECINAMPIKRGTMPNIWLNYRQRRSDGPMRSFSLSLLQEGSGRTLEAIKGQKKKPAYKELVKEALLELEEEARSVAHIKQGPPIPTTDPEAELHPCPTTTPTKVDEASPNALIMNAMATLAENNPNDLHPTLLYICKRVHTLTNVKLRMKLAALIPKLIPSRTRRPRRARHPTPPLTTIRNKERRRLDYKCTQAQWSKNPGRCIKDILGINISPDYVPPKECMVPYWKTKMLSTTRSTPGYSNHGPPTLALWAPIEISDIAGCYPPTSSAMGPDGIHSRDVRKIEPRTLAILLNLLMLCDRPPDSLLEARTVLIPKKQAPKEPGDFRPCPSPQCYPDACTRSWLSESAY